MRTNFLILLFCLSAFTVFGQFPQPFDGLDYGFTVVPIIKKDLSKVVGSPFLNENFEKGVINMEGKEPLVAKMRYNVLEERIEIKLDQAGSDEIFMLPKRETTIYQFGGDQFYIKRIITEGGPVFGYFIPLFTGTNVELLKKYSLNVSEAQAAKTGYDEDKPAKMSIEEKYYVRLPNKEFQEVEISTRKLRKDFEDVLESKYFKNNKIKTEEDLVALVKELDRVQK